MTSAQRPMTFCATLIETLERYAEEGTLLNLVLRSVPLIGDMPADIREKTQGVRIIYVGVDYLAVGPKKPICDMIVPPDEIAMVTVSEQVHRPDEDKIDKRIEEEYPGWERDFPGDEGITVSRWAMSGEEGGIRNLDGEDLWAIVEQARYMVLDIYAPWCQPCAEVAAAMEELAAQYGDRVLFGKIDGDSNDEVCEEFNVSSYPTVILFRDGAEYKRIEGSRSPERFSERIEAMLSAKKPGRVKNKIADGKLHTMTTEEIEEILSESSLSVVMFFEKGDYECQLQSQTLRELAKEYKHRVFFTRADAKREPLAKKLRVKRTPCIYLMVDGDVKGYTRARLTKSEIREVLEEVLSEYCQGFE